MKSQRRSGMLLGVDASNLRRGGGLTHISELLRAPDPTSHGFSTVIVWGGKTTLDRIEDRPWIDKRSDALLSKGLLHRTLWQRTRLPALAREAGCDVLFVPGGTYQGHFRPVVTLSQNMLPFELRELRRFGASWATLRLLLLRWTQTRTFRNADGLIFLTDYARDAVERAIGGLRATTTVIPHGINSEFSTPPREQLPITAFCESRPMRVVYVSIVNVYKHQWHVAEAVGLLRSRGIPLQIDFIGPAYPPALRRLTATLRRLDPASRWARYAGPVPYSELPSRYSGADVCVFASSCENMPIILLEAMAAGLPVACARRGPMPEMLRDGGVYFDPEHPADIARALESLVASPTLRAQSAARSFELSRGYSWERCAERTFSFLAAIAAEHSS